jgi:hypothetical protein
MQASQITRDTEESRLRRLDDAQRLGYGQLLRTHHFNGTVTMFFEKGELRYSLPDGWSNGR